MLIFGQRLREERKRLGLKQKELAEQVSTSNAVQSLYESGNRSPSLVYLAAVAEVGVDVLYVLTGQRNTSDLSPDEQSLLSEFRSLDAGGRAGVLGMIGGMKQQANAQVATGRKVKQSFENTTIGQRVKGDITAPFTINMGTGKPRKKSGD